MSRITSYLAAALVGTTLLVPAADTFARDRDEHREWRHEDNGWKHGHHRRHHHHHHHYQSPRVIYQQSYWVPAPPPPPVVYRPAYYEPSYYSHREPALTIGVSVPPLVIPLR